MNRKIVLLLLCFALLLVSAEPIGIDEKGVVGPTIQTPGKYSDVQKSLIDGRYLKGTKGVLWAQIPDTNTAGGILCQLDSVDPFDCDLVDDIIIEGAGWVIDSATTWWHNWNTFRNWGYIPNIHFLVYADSGIATPHPVDSPFIDIVVPQSNYTATMFATDTARFRVDMELPTPVVLPGGVRYWIEVQPANVLTINGQTGWQMQLGIGNGQEFYLRVPEWGYLSWLDATSLVGSPNEVGFILYGSIVSDTITWDFETGLQGWTHTNGLPFPGGWDVEPSGIHTPPPSADDSTLWIDAYAYGPLGADTAWSPVIVPNAVSTQWVKYGVEFYGSSGTYTDDLYVGIRTFTGGMWNPPVELKHYVQGTYFNGWDSVDVSAYNTADRMQIYFCYDDSYSYGYWTGVDNITVNGQIYVSSHDVGVVSIDEPGASIPPSTPFTPTATYKNFGSNPETFDAYYQIDSAAVTVYLEMVNLTLNPGDDTTVAFTDHISGSGVGVVYDIYAYTILVGDGNPANDMISQTTTINPWQIVTNMPQTLMDHAVVFDGSDIYVLGGYNGVTSLDSVFIYKQSKGVWSVGASMPVDLCMYDACVLGDTIYVPGGLSYGAGAIQDYLYKYSISGNNWVTSAGTGEPAWFYACAAANGKVYRIGGFDDATSTQWASTWAYTPGAGWTKMTDMPTPTELAVRWVRNNNIYIAGGIDGATSVMYNETQVYDAVNDVWTQDPTIFAYLPYTRWGAGSAFYRDTVYVMSGVNSAWGLSDTVFYYAYGTNTWNIYPSVIQSVYRTDGIGVEGVGAGFDGIYLFGGSIGGFSPIADVQATKILPSGIDEYIDEEARSQLSVPMSIGKGEIKFTYNGEVPKNIIVADITGRIVKRYDNVRPGSSLHFGSSDISSGIYFLSIEGDRNSTRKITLIR
ncbi:hypothetical protein KAX08_09485 [candidate division WOR-3 bacterium]|nr:hypothetical protein [candidate division WOR-3 bacterium]